MIRLGQKRDATYRGDEMKTSSQITQTTTLGDLNRMMQNGEQRDLFLKARVVVALALMETEDLKAAGQAIIRRCGEDRLLTAAACVVFGDATGTNN
jgi:hypothetical protein